MTADVVAVVVRWRGGEEVLACVEALEAHGGPRLAGVILVDSGSGDGGAAHLAARFPAIRVVALEENLGFAHAANRGAGEGDEPMLLLLNPDTQLLPGSLDELTRGLDDHPDVSATVPVLVDPDGSPQHRWQLRRLPSTIRLATGRSGAPAFVRPPTRPCPVAQPAAAAWLVRRTVWEALGGFDEAYRPAWWEDVDFCARLEALRGSGSFPATRGFIVRPSARILHHGGSSVASLGDEAFAVAYHSNLLRYAAAHHPERLALIRFGLSTSLRLRAALRPSRRRSCRAALSSLDEP